MLAQISTTFHTYTRKITLSLRDTQTVAIISIILCCICWSWGTLWTKTTLDYFPPILLLTVQLAASSAFLWTLSAMNGSIKAVTHKTVWIGLSGILEPGLAYILGIQGLAITSASSAALIGAIDPLVGVGMAWLILRERVTRRMAFFAGLALAGTTFVEVTGVGNGLSLHGLLLLLGSIVFSALYGVAAKRDSNALPVLPLTALNQTFGLLTAIVAVIVSGQIRVDGIPVEAWGAALVTGVTQYAMAFLFYIMAVRHISSSKASVMMMLIPILSLVGAIVVLGDTFTPIQIIGGAVAMYALSRFTANANVG